LNIKNIVISLFCLFLTVPIFASDRDRSPGSSSDPHRSPISFLTPERRKIAALVEEVNKLRQENASLESDLRCRMESIIDLVLPNRNALVSMLERHKVYDATFAQVDANRIKFRAFMDQVESFMTSY
jgi:hypothetical protein